MGLGWGCSPLLLGKLISDFRQLLVHSPLYYALHRTAPLPALSLCLSLSFSLCLTLYLCLKHKAQLDKAQQRLPSFESLHVEVLL